MTENNMYHITVLPKNKEYEYDVFVSGVPYDEQKTDSKEMDNVEAHIDDAKPDKVTSFLFSIAFYDILFFLVVIILGNYLGNISGYNVPEISNLASSILVCSSVILAMLSFDKFKGLFDGILKAYDRKTFYHFCGVIIFGVAIILSAKLYTYVNWALDLFEFISLICILIALHQYCYEKKS